MRVTEPIPRNIAGIFEVCEAQGPHTFVITMGHAVAKALAHGTKLPAHRTFEVYCNNNEENRLIYQNLFKGFQTGKRRFRIASWKRTNYNKRTCASSKKMR